MSNELFLDAGYAIALASPSDQYHTFALQLADRLEADRTRLVTTQAIVLEIGNGLAKARFRNAAVQLLDSLHNDTNIELTPLTVELFAKARSLFRNRMDKEWGLTDCISFVVMQERGLAAALTADVHFEQAGFRALLRNP